LNTTFSEIADDAALLVDSNIFVYAFTGKSSECARLIQRCRDERVQGFVSVCTLLEVCHKTMGLEAAGPGAQSPVAAKHLKDHPQTVRSLSRYASFMEDVVLRCNLSIIVVSEADILQSQQVRDRYGLLSTDSINAHLLLKHGIPAIATNDTDFDRIKGIRVYKPGDMA